MFSELPPLVRRGISEFNRGRFYECHEYLEDAWREEPGHVRSLYQGILQIGVGLHHRRNGNFPGAMRLLTKGLTRLREFPPDALGIDVNRLRDETIVCLKELDRLGENRSGEFDASLVPVISPAK